MEKKEDTPMTRQQQMAEDMFAADEQFRNQFDRSNPAYHGGNETAVPTHEQKRVPESMPTEQDPNAKPADDSYLNDQEYITTMELRGKFQEMKKIMPRLCSPIEMMLRLKTSAKEEEALQAALDQEKKKIDDAKAQLMPYIENLDNFPQYKEKYANELRECIDFALTHSFKDKEELTDFNFRVKRVSQAVFKEITTLLAEVKKIKARCAGK